MVYFEFKERSRMNLEFTRRVRYLIVSGQQMRLFTAKERSQEFFFDFDCDQSILRSRAIALVSLFLHIGSVRV